MASHSQNYIHRLDVYTNCSMVFVEVAPVANQYASIDGVSWSILPDTNTLFTNLSSTLVGTLGANNVSWASGTNYEEPQFIYGEDGKGRSLLTLLVTHLLAENGHVFLRGIYQASSGNVQNNTLLGIVPGNLRPSYTLSFPAIARTAAERSGDRIVDVPQHLTDLLSVFPFLPPSPTPLPATAWSSPLAARLWWPMPTPRRTLTSTTSSGRCGRARCG